MIISCSIFAEGIYIGRLAWILDAERKTKEGIKVSSPLQIQYHHFESLPLTANLFFI